MLSFYELYHLIQEGYKGKKEQFLKQGNNTNTIDYYFNKLKNIKTNPNQTLLNHNIPNLTISVNDRLNIDKYPNFKQLEIFVDYYEGQLNKSKIDFDNVEFSGKPLTEKNGLVIYYADTPKACVEIKGDADHSWCIARPAAGNMFYSLRFGEQQPAFYFIKNQNRKDKYYFFVLQVLKGAELGNVTNQQYIVTSSENDGELQMSWSQIVSIEPRLDGLQEIFVHKPLSPKQQELYNRFKDGLTDEEFAALLTDKERSFYIDVYGVLTDEQFRICSTELKNKYIGTSDRLSYVQYKMIKDKPGLIKRYVEIVLRKLKEDIKDNQSLCFIDVECIVLRNNITDELLNEIISKPYYAFHYAKDVLKGFDVPPEVLNGFIEVPEYIFEYIRDVLDGKEVPPEFINSLSKDPGYAFDYAKEILGWEDVPPEIINSIVEKSYYAFLYAKYLALKGKEVPPEVISGISKDPEYALEYAIYVLKGKDVPEEVLDSINSHSYFAKGYKNFLDELRN